mmetsp:Transcript_150507/g.481772  ORF Transcript_150507/g.481772 Transcript_150507/m.481772 type:complete len:673 (+) Transcript_150507:121-2139(+)
MRAVVAAQLTAAQRSRSMEGAGCNQGSLHGRRQRCRNVTKDASMGRSADHGGDVALRASFEGPAFSEVAAWAVQIEGRLRSLELDLAPMVMETARSELPPSPQIVPRPPSGPRPQASPKVHAAGRCLFARAMGQQASSAAAPEEEDDGLNSIQALREPHHELDSTMSSSSSHISEKVECSRGAWEHDAPIQGAPDAANIEVQEWGALMQRLNEFEAVMSVNQDALAERLALAEEARDDLLSQQASGRLTVVEGSLRDTCEKIQEVAASQAAHTDTVQAILTSLQKELKQLSSDVSGLGRSTLHLVSDHEELKQLSSDVSGLGRSTLHLVSDHEVHEALTSHRLSALEARQDMVGHAAIGSQAMSGPMPTQADAAPGRVSLVEGRLQEITSEVKQMVGTLPADPQDRLVKLEAQIAALSSELRRNGQSTLSYVSDQAVVEAQTAERLRVLEETCQRLSRALHGKEVMLGSAAGTSAADASTGKEGLADDLRAKLGEDAAETGRRLNSLEDGLEELRDNVKEVTYATSRHAARTAERLDDLERSGPSPVSPGAGTSFSNISGSPHGSTGPTSPTRGPRRAPRSSTEASAPTAPFTATSAAEALAAAAVAAATSASLSQAAPATPHFPPDAITNASSSQGVLATPAAAASGAGSAEVSLSHASPAMTSSAPSELS